MKLLRLSRRGKKASVTRRCDEIRALVTEGGERTDVGLKAEGLKCIFQELTLVVDELVGLSEAVDEHNDLELTWNQLLPSSLLT